LGVGKRRDFPDSTEYTSFIPFENDKRTYRRMTDEPVAAVCIFDPHSSHRDTTQSQR